MEENIDECTIDIVISDYRKYTENAFMTESLYTEVMQLHIHIYWQIKRIILNINKANVQSVLIMKMLLLFNFNKKS